MSYQPPGGPNPYDPQQPPPIQNPYEQPSGYGTSPNPMPEPQYTFMPPNAQTPLPLGQAIQNLPNQYIKIVTRPGAQSFAEEQGKADWGIIWLQLIFVGLVGTLIGLLRSAMGTAALTGNAGSSAMAYSAIAGVIAGSASVASIIFVIIGFFIIVGIQYLLAKAFGGNGDFKQQAYNYLLFYVPLTVVSNIIGLIPLLGGIVGFAIAIYQIVLNVFSIMAAHRLSGGKATAVVLIPYAVLILLAFLCAIAIAALIFSAASSINNP